MPFQRLMGGFRGKQVQLQWLPVDMFDADTGKVKMDARKAKVKCYITLSHSLPDAVTYLPSAMQCKIISLETKCVKHFKPIPYYKNTESVKTHMTLLE
jgi:hypothetical protein